MSDLSSGGRTFYQLKTTLFGSKIVTFSEADVYSFGIDESPVVTLNNKTTAFKTMDKLEFFYKNQFNSSHKYSKERDIIEPSLNYIPVPFGNLISGLKLFVTGLFGLLLIPTIPLYRLYLVRLSSNKRKFFYENLKVEG